MTGAKMRVDLSRSKNRPWYMRLGLAIAKRRLGIYPAPPLTLSYRPAFFHRSFAGYILRANHGSGGWTKGEAEMFAAFVSDLNSCRY